MEKHGFEDAAVAAVFAGYPARERKALLALRSRIFEVAAKNGIALSEALRWGQPAYLAAKGSTIRLGLPKTGGYAIYAHCQTTLISDLRLLAPELRFEGNRAVHFSCDETPSDVLDLLIHSALTYHMA